MPAFLGGSGGLGAKIVSVFPGNVSVGKPMIQGAVIVMDVESGRVRALLDGASLTEIRTAAGSGLATELLADPAADGAAASGPAPRAARTSNCWRRAGAGEIRIVSVLPRRRGVAAASPLGPSPWCLPKGAFPPKSGRPRPRPRPDGADLV